MDARVVLGGGGNSEHVFQSYFIICSDFIFSKNVSAIYDQI